jgi:UDP-N-acetylmuramoyl-L-alanyl-D-glutamate--2,6-diaminopimelate ligase
VAAQFHDAPGVPGRLERCDTPRDGISVFVDYAHTPDALERVLATLRSFTRGRVICVFGCGGDRDKGKRPLMGQVSGRLADQVIVTNDNPRSEAPEVIASSIVEGLRLEATPYDVILDRAHAIERAISSARAEDTVLIAGKGHETYQIIGDSRIDFDDREHARAALELRSGRQSN